MYHHFLERTGKRRQPPYFTLQISGTSLEDAEVNVYYHDQLTTGQMNGIIRQALLRRGKKDPVLLQLLFHNSLLALGEDDAFRRWYQAETGVDLREVSAHDYDQ